MRNGVYVDELEGGYRSPPLPPGFHPNPQGAQLIETLESFDGPWQRAGRYGRLVTAPYPATVDATPLSIFSIDKQNGPPRARTLHLFRSDARIIPDAFINADVYASITYGVGGVQNNFLCDWGRGGQIPLVCDTFRIDAVPYAPLFNTPYAPPPVDQLQTLGAMLGHQGVSVPRSPTFTTPRVIIPPSFDATFLVPDFAREVAAFATNSDDFDSAHDVLLEFLNFSDSAIAEINMTPELALVPMPIPGSTTQIRIVHNGSGSITNAYGLLFILGL
jgi:hypothetical protein